MTYNLDAHHPCALQAAIVHILDICHCPHLIYPDSLSVQASCTITRSDEEEKREEGMENGVS